MRNTYSKYAVPLLLLLCIGTCNNPSGSNDNPSAFIGVWASNDTQNIDSTTCPCTVQYSFYSNSYYRGNSCGQCANGRFEGLGIPPMQHSWYVQGNFIFLNQQKCSYSFCNDTCLEITSDSLSQIFTRISKVPTNL